MNFEVITSGNVQVNLHLYLLLGLKLSLACFLLCRDKNKYSTSFGT